MHIAIIIIAIILVGGGIFIQNKIHIEPQKEKSVVLGQGATSTPTNPPTPTKTEPTNSPTSPAKQDPASQDSTNLTFFIYPSALVKSQTSETITLTSNDDAQVITDWYKEKIKELNMSTRSFVQTKANDTVKNVLAAAKNNDEIKVTITKNSGESQVSIIVER